VKLNGDYLDTRIKNTPEELSGYHPSIDRLLDRVLDEYGLIVCGWSADWDTALRRAFERCPSDQETAQRRRCSACRTSRRRGHPHQGRGHALHRSARKTRGGGQ
jgi:hypothetical protein